MASRARAVKGWLGPALTTAALFLSAEAGLRLAGFRYAHHPVAMRYVSTMAHLGADQALGRKRFHIDYALDRVLLWKPLPAPGITNSLGFVGPEWSEEKPPGAARVIALGDSCTVAGDDPYPAVLSARLSRGAGSWEVMNAGVGSWSSYQGLKLLETRLLRYRPDVVTVYFGWNDHWLAWAAPDKDLAGLLDRQWKLLKTIEKSRLLQALLRARDALRRGGGLPRFSAATPYRVSLEDYESNLKEMVRLVRAAGGEAVLATAPATLTPEHPVTLALCRQTHNFHEPERIREVHEAYNGQVRAVARATGAPLADLAEAFSRMPDVDGLFRDGIHLTPEGHRRAAALLEPIVRSAVKAGGRAPQPPSGKRSAAGVSGRRRP